jgi:hypothetical protein
MPSHEASAMQVTSNQNGGIMIEGVVTHGEAAGEGD